MTDLPDEAADLDAQARRWRRVADTLAAELRRALAVYEEALAEDEDGPP